MKLLFDKFKLSAFFGVLLTLTILFAPLVSRAATQALTVTEYLQQQTDIRVFADGEDGLGNQSASANVITRLRQMGYQGKFEFIYPDFVFNKIAILYDLADDTPADYVDEKLNIEFIKLTTYMSQYENNEIKPISLGLSGVSVGNVCEYARAVGVKGTEKYHCLNFANMLNSNYFIMLSPFISGEMSDEATKYDTFIYTKDSAKTYQLNSDNKFIVMPVASLADAKAYLASDQRGQNLLKQKPVLDILVNKIDDKKFNLLPVYGYTIQVRGGSSVNLSNDYMYARMTNMLELITGARKAQLSQVKNMNKPLVIPVFYDYQVEAHFLDQLINGNIWDTITDKNALNLKSMIANLDLPNHFMITNADDPHAVEQINHLKDNQILLLSMGSLPKTVFDGLYTYTNDNIWPQMREGANTFNSLILTGRPHMRCGDGDGWEIGYNRIQDADFLTWFKKFYPAGFCSGQLNTWKTDDIPTLVSQFIINSQDEHSALSSYFEDLKTAALDPANDRIYYALEGVLEKANDPAPTKN